MYAHAWALLDLKPNESPDMSLSLHRGVTVRARIVGPDGQPDPDAAVYCVLNQYPGMGSHNGYGVPARGGRFAFTGCDPERSYIALVLDLGRRLGAALTISGKQAGDEVTIRLAPCGAARARLLDGKGQPLADEIPELRAVLVPGPHGIDKKHPEVLLAEEGTIRYPDHLSMTYHNREKTDAEGRVTMLGLVPGATYRIGEQFGALSKEFTVGSGQTVDLGEITIKTSD